MTDAATLQARLAEAEDTYHKLLTGQVVNKIKVWDREIDNNAINVNQLRLYIAELRANLGLPPMTAPRTPARRIFI